MSAVDIILITNLVAHDISRNTRRNYVLLPHHQVLIALRLCASGSFLQVTGDTFGINKSTVSRVINDVIQALISKQPRFIKWSLTNNKKMRSDSPRRVPLCNSDART